MYKTLGIANGKLLLVQGIYGAVGPIANFLLVRLHLLPGLKNIMMKSLSSFITLLLDRIGRRRPLLFGAASFVCTFSVLSAIVCTFPAGDGMTTNLAAQRAGVAMIFLTSIIFSLSFGPISWVLASEVQPYCHR